MDKERRSAQDTEHSALVDIYNLKSHDMVKDDYNIDILLLTFFIC